MRILFFIIIIFLKYNIAFSDEKIAFINLNYIMNNSISGKSINNYLNNMRNNKLKEFQEIENKIKEDENDIISKKNIIEENVYKTKVEDIKKRINEYKKKRQTFNKSLDENKIKYTNKLLEKLNPIISDYVEKNSIILVLPKKIVIVGKKSLDITLPILEILDKSIQKINFNE